MKKSTLLNSEVSYEISKMGHTDGLVICDSGLPIPLSNKRIDLAITRNLPRFMDVFDATTSELCIEAVVMAKEFKDSELHNELINKIKDLESTQKNKIKLEYVDHEVFKQLSKDANCFIRTGECTPYANVILKSGVVF
jgi:D-ribose pyranase